MSELINALNKLLPTIARLGDFYATGRVAMFAPSLEVDGAGRIAFPLLPVQAQQLIALAEQAPYGRGEETLVDTEVRSTWQIDATRVHIGGRHWEQTLNTIVTQAAEGLGVTDPVCAELYKMLVYEADSFFAEHRDTEKALGMFATLIIVLPCDYEGGALMVRHRDKEVVLDLHCKEASEAVFAAFYADCIHAIYPITQGHRLTLVYNLIRTGETKTQAQLAPIYDHELTEITARLQRWVEDSRLPDHNAPLKLVYPLEHAYTCAELSFETLKNADAAVARVLVAAANQAQCETYLALISIEENGIAEYVGSGYYNDEMEAGEVIDRLETITQWRCPNGSVPVLSALPLFDGELCPPNALENAVPDDEYFHEATGNEGASFERTYRIAALVVWPVEQKIAVLNQAGLSVTLPYLADLAQRWAHSSAGNTQSSLWQEAHALADAMLRRWSPLLGDYQQKMENEITMLTCLHQLLDTVHIARFFANVSANGCYGGNENEAIVHAAQLLKPQQAIDLIKNIINSNAARAINACTNLLALTYDTFPDEKHSLYSAATLLVETLESSEQSTLIQIDLFVDLLTALFRLEACTLGTRVVSHALALPTQFSMDKLLLPAALRLVEQQESHDFEPVQQLRTACLQHLQTRMSEPLAPPENFTRDNTVCCNCTACVELSQFLAAPDRNVWQYRAAESLRSHVEHTIRRSHCDLSHITSKTSRPYILVCTKNQASYERRVQQRKNDGENRKKLSH